MTTAGATAKELGQVDYRDDRGNTFRLMLHRGTADFGIPNIAAQQETDEIRAGFAAKA